jgi:hypothetical protein
MKALICALLIIVVSVAVVYAGPEHLIKQRAKDVRDQNNERQGVTPASPAPAPARAATPPQPSAVPQAPRPSGPALSPQAVRIGEALGNLSAAGEVTDAQRQQLLQSLDEAARGAAKPSVGKVKKLAGDLVLAVEGTALTSTQRSVLASQLERALNDPLGATEMETLARQVQDTLRGAGTGKVDATIVANDLKSIIADMQRGAKN